MSAKRRVTVTVDEGVVDAGGRAVASGRAASVSAWVNEALLRTIERERGLQVLADAVRDHEAEFGEITEAELAAQRRADGAAAVAVRPGFRSASA